MVSIEGETSGTETQYNRKIVTVDQEAWMKKRLGEFALLLKDIYRREAQFPGASMPMINGAINGSIEGLSIELIRTLNCEPCFVNIRKWVDEGLDWSLKEPRDMI